MNSDLNVMYSKRAESGFTLIELMIAVALMLLVSFAVINVYLTTRSTTKAQTAVARMNENWQTNSENIAREFRELSFMGCVPVGTNLDSNGDSTIKSHQLRNGSTRNYSAAQVNVVSVLKQVGASDPDVPSNAIAGNAIISVSHAANDGAHLLTAMPDRGGSGIRFKSNPHITTPPSGVLAVISDCRSGEIFKVAGASSNPTAATNWKIAPLSDLIVQYGEDARVAPLTVSQFYLAPSDRVAGERSTTALYRRTLNVDGVSWNSATQIARDVTSMQITAAVDGGGYVPDPINVAWSAGLVPEKVMGINLTFVMQGPPDARANGAVLTRTFTTYISARARAL